LRSVVGIVVLRRIVLGWWVVAVVFGGFGELVDSVDTAAGEHCGLDQSHGQKGGEDMCKEYMRVGGEADVFEERDLKS
jgi:hypothetical protein